MPVQITITGENAQEALREIGGLSAGLVGAAAPVVDKPARTAKAVTKPVETKQEEPVQTEVEPTQEKTGSTDDPVEVTVEDIRAKAAEVGQAGKKDEIKALLGEFKVKTISSVPAEKRAEFLAALEALVE